MAHGSTAGGGGPVRRGVHFPPPPYWEDVPPREHLDLLCAFGGAFRGPPYRGPGGGDPDCAAPLPGDGRHAGVRLHVDREERDVLLLRPCRQEPAGRGPGVRHPAGADQPDAERPGLSTRTGPSPTSRPPVPWTDGTEHPDCCRFRPPA